MPTLQVSEREVLNIIPRIFHTVSIHGQEEGRFSYTKPPLAQLPDDLENLYIPDPGWPWKCWDWDQIESRIICALCRDEQLTKEINEGWDQHTLLACELFDLLPCADPVDPHKSPQAETWRAEVNWKGKKDLRRKLGKNLNHALKYGKDPRLAHHMPGFKSAGIRKDLAIRGATRFLARYPRMLEWRVRVAEYAKQHREVRSFMGRRWVLFEQEEGALKRRAYNGPGQMGVTDIHNEVMVQTHQEFEEQVLWKWGKHDDQKWAILEAYWSSIAPRLEEIAEQEWDVEGLRTRFPATFKEIWA